MTIFCTLKTGRISYADISLEEARDSKYLPNFSLLTYLENTIILFEESLVVNRYLGLQDMYLYPR